MNRRKLVAIKRNESQAKKMKILKNRRAADVLSLIHIKLLVGPFFAQL